MWYAVPSTWHPDPASDEEEVHDEASIPGPIATDAPWTDGEQYCYRVSACYADCESAMSEPLCATAGGVPTAVDLSSLAADARLGAILVTWQTASEMDDLGFHRSRIHRGDR